MLKRWVLLLLSAFIISVLHMQAFSSPWGTRIEPLSLDLWFNLRGAVEPPQDVVVVAMDESSYRVLDVPLDKAWPRALHADLLKRLHDYGVRRVAMDILFLGEGGDFGVDKGLAEAMKLSPTVIGADAGTREVASSAGSFTMEELLTPPEIFTQSAEKIALARLPDDDGAVRRFYVPRTSATRDIPSLYEAAAGYQSGDKAIVPGPRDFLYYYGPPGTITTYSIHQVLNSKGALPKEAFKDKVVFVGLSLRTELGPAQKDTYRTPFYDRGSIFGVEIQATAAANLLTNTWIRRAGVWSEWLTLFLVTLMLSFAIFYLRPQWSALLVTCSITGWCALSYMLFLNGFFLPGTILVSLVLPVTFLVSTLAYYLITHKSQRQVERAFEMYLSPDMVKQLSSDTKGLSLGGESTYATALFTDIENFTSITEQMSASEVSAMLNAYFTDVMDVVIENKGTLIKFIGDAVFALWGAPIKHPDHARLACETAMQIQKGVARFNSTKRFPPLYTRVGVNTGTMLVGNLGSARRFDYTALGDSVNLASRLEGLNKYFGTSILLSETTRKEAGGKIQAICIGSIVVAGKSEAIEIYTLFEEGISPEIEESWRKGLDSFRLRKWDQARQAFEEIKNSEPRLRGCADVYIAEVARLTHAEPNDAWRGEISFDHK